MATGDGSDESLESGSGNSMGVVGVMTSSGEANLSCEIGESGEEFESGFDGLGVSSSSSETNCSSDKAVYTEGRLLARPVTGFIKTQGGVIRKWG